MAEYRQLQIDLEAERARLQRELQEAMALKAGLQQEASTMKAMGTLVQVGSCCLPACLLLLSPEPGTPLHLCTCYCLSPEPSTYSLTCHLCRPVRCVLTCLAPWTALDPPVQRTRPQICGSAAWWVDGGWLI